MRQRHVQTKAFVVLAAVLLGSLCGQGGIIMRRGASGSNGLLNGLVAYWKLDEASGAAVDAHASFDLTDVNSDIGASTTHYWLGGSARNTGTSPSDNTRLEWADAPENSPTGAFTITGWARIAVTGTIDYRYLVSKSANGNMSFGLYYTDTYLRWFISDSGSGVGGSCQAAVPATGTPFRFAVGYDGVNAFLRIDQGGRILRAQAGAYDGTAPFCLFGLSDGYAWNVHRGQLDEVALWNRALTDEEIDVVFAGIGYDAFDQ